MTQLDLKRKAGVKMVQIFIARKYTLIWKNTIPIMDWT